MPNVDRNLQKNYNLHLFGLPHAPRLLNIIIHDDVAPVKKEVIIGVKDESNVLCTTNCHKERKFISILMDRYSVPFKLSTRIVHSVMQASSRYGLPSELLMGIISVESDFYPYAESDGGARGLMQVMPNIHKHMIKNEFGQNTDALWRPESNIMIGARILNEYMSVSRGNFFQALKRYNGSFGIKNNYPNKVLSAASSFGFGKDES
jgi:hypothetical protein